MTNTKRKEPVPCKAPECERKALARGLCSLHYQRIQRGAPLEGNPPPTCCIVGCDDRVKARLMCAFHYNRWRAGRDLEREKRLVSPYRDRVRVERKSKKAFRLAPGEAGAWCVRGDGYVSRTRALLDGTRIREVQHRVVMEERLGRPLLPHENVHHLNGDRADNRIENLELWSRSQPAGQRVSDKVAWAREIIALYEEMPWI